MQKNIEPKTTLRGRKKQQKDIPRKKNHQIETIIGGTINMEPVGVIAVLKMQERREGKREGKLEERAKALEEKKEVAQILKQKGVSLDIIVESTKLPLKVIEAL